MVRNNIVQTIRVTMIVYKVYVLIVPDKKNISIIALDMRGNQIYNFLTLT